jgi:type IV pilus secretin PilQ/predicted competence protein
MVKVGSMRKAKQVLLMASVLLVGFGDANASWLHRGKSDKPKAQPVAAPSMTLDSVEADASHVTLHTSGMPAYTSYSPSPAVFVVDLTSASKGPAVAIPTSLPAGIGSISAEEVTEMGTKLTRVVFRLVQPVVPTASAVEKSIVVAMPATAFAETALPAVEASKSDVPHVEPIADVTPQPVVVEPVAKSEPIPDTTSVAPASPASTPLEKARVLRRVETTGSGSTFEVRIAGDGALSYKAFRLENPTRLVIDISGVKIGVAKPAMNVDDAIVKKVRVGQFKSAPDPVARVVLELASKANYKITEEGDHLRVAFGDAIASLGTSSPAPKPAEPQMLVAEKPSAEKTAVAPASPPVATSARPSAVTPPPVVAEKAPTWKLPVKHTTKEPKAVINAGLAQTPPSTTRNAKNAAAAASQGNAENVFNEAPPDQSEPTSRGGQVLSGGQGGTARTLSPGQTVYSGEPISLNLKDADIKDVIRTFADLTGLNIAVDPQVSGTVTVNFNEVPWDQALSIILRQNNLTYTIEGNVMRVGTIDRLSQEAAATRRLAEEDRLNVPLVTVIFKLSYARANDVQGLLKDIASQRARIIVDARTNQLIISEIPAQLQTIRNLIETVDVPTRQVMIEARIVEASKVFQQQYGFNWGFNGSLDPALGTGTGLVFPNRVGFIGGPFDFGPGNSILQLRLTDVLGSFNLDFALNAFEFEGLVKVVSAPRVTTTDNIPAEIQSGFQIPYQTRVNFTTTVTYIDATLRLSVTPQITEAGTVIMDIQVQKNEPTTGLAIEGAAGTPLSTRSAKTRLMVRDGGTAVIGGIYQVKDNNSITRLPFVHQIPILGNLFKTHNISTSHDELLIFITPRIIRGA